MKILPNIQKKPAAQTGSQQSGFSGATDVAEMKNGRVGSVLRIRSVCHQWLKFIPTALRLGVAAVSLLLALTAAAQQYAVPWFKIAGGGAMQSTGGVFALSGTIGQLDAGRVASTNDHYRLESGFWGIAVQQAGFPSLSVTQQSTNAVLSWITPETGFIVQFTTNLTPSTVWTDLGPATSTNGTTNAVAVPFDDAERAFFRLRRK